MPTALSGHVSSDVLAPTQSRGHGARHSPDSETFNFRWLLLLAATMLVALAGPAIIGHVYTADDLGAFHLPMRAFYADCLKHGVAFDWSPQLYGGFYLTGEGQIGGYHPLHWLLYRWLPLSVAFDLECLIGYPVMLAGMYFFLRRWSLRRDAAMFGAISFAFSGFCLLHFVHVNAIEVVAHLPWLLWAIHGMFDEGRRSRTLAGATFALLTASQWLLGYPQYVFYSAIAEIGYAALLIHGLDGAKPQAARKLRCWLRLGFWAALGTLIGAVQLLPTLEALQESTRQTAGGDFTNWGSLAPLNLVQLIAPYLFTTRVVGQNTHELGLYAGAITLLLAIGCLASGKVDREHKRLRTAAGALTVIGFCLTLGCFGPFGVLFAHLPILCDFRFPCRAIVLIHLGLAVLAAIGFQRLTPSKREFNFGLRTRPISIILATSLALAVAAPFCWPPFVAAPAFRWLGPELLALSVLVIRQVAYRRRRSIALLCIFTAFDLGAYGMSYAVYSQHKQLEPYVAKLFAPSEYRIVLDCTGPNEPGLRAGNEQLLAGARRIDGYAGLEPARRLDYRVPAALRAADVGRVCGGNLSDAELYECAMYYWNAEKPLLYVRLVTHTVVSANPAQDISRIPLETTALVNEPLRLERGSPGSARVMRDETRIAGKGNERKFGSDIPGDIRIKVAAPGRQLLVLAESFHSGWQASADGIKVPIVRTNGDFMGCVVEPGMKEIDFQFAPASLRYGLLLSILGLSLLVAVTLGGIVIRRRHRTH